MKPYRNAERTKKWIRRAFTELMAEKKDIEKISVTELAERADISKTTFYYHYEDIYAVAEEFENELIDALSDALKEIGKGAAAQPLNIEEYTHGIFSFLKANEESYRMVMGASSPRLFLDKLKKIIVRKTEESAAFLPFSNNPEERQVQIYFLSSACVDVVVEYFRGGFSASFETVTDVILEAINKLKE